MTNNHGSNESSSQHGGGNLLVKLLKWTDGLWKANHSVSDVVTQAMLGEQETLSNATYHSDNTMTTVHHGPTSSSKIQGGSSFHPSHDHGHAHHGAPHSPTIHGSHDSHSSDHSSSGGSHEYHLAEIFERAVEMINTVAGVIVLVSKYSFPYPYHHSYTNCCVGDRYCCGYQPSWR